MVTLINLICSVITNSKGVILGEECLKIYIYTFLIVHSLVQNFK